MPLMLLKQRNGKLRPSWYGYYREDGVQRVFNLNVPWRGTPPASGRVADTGDVAFERSRVKAEEAVARHVEELRHKGRAEHLTERLIESKTGRAVEYVALADLAQRWRTAGRETNPCVRYLAACDAHFKRFVTFMAVRSPAVRHLYEVKPDDAAAFVSSLQTVLARKTARDGVKLLHRTFANYLPVGTANPFAAFMGRGKAGKNETVHRKPFTPEELALLFAAARTDAFMYPLITAAACTGMRRGDVCALRWQAVDLPGGMLTVKTSKTGADVEIPIFDPLRAVLEERKGNGSDLVFPEAAAMLQDNPDGLTWRFKKIVAAAFAGEAPPPLEPARGPKIQAEGVAVMERGLPEGLRRNRILDTFRRYCEGASVRQIETATGRCRAQISGDLHTVQTLLGKQLLRAKTGNIKAAIQATTQAHREQGQRAASVRDWHALRATWVTLALAAGVPVEIVRRVTGHATVEIITKHYFRPDREQFRTALVGSLPEVITGEKPDKPSPADELATLARKVATGIATNADKARVRVLAASI
jgi:integrase